MAAGDTVQKAAKAATSSTRKAASTAKGAGTRATRSTKASARKVAATAKATTAARAGKVEEAKQVAAQADLSGGVAERAIEAADALHYQVEVNKKRVNVGSLTDSLNERWRNGWHLAHIFEQRGNTVMVFEKRD